MVSSEIYVDCLKITLLGEKLYKKWIEYGFNKVTITELENRLKWINKDIEGDKITLENLLQILNSNYKDIDWKYYIRSQSLEIEYKSHLLNLTKKDEIRETNENIYLSTHFNGSSDDIFKNCCHIS